MLRCVGLQKPLALDGISNNFKSAKLVYDAVMIKVAQCLYPLGKAYSVCDHGDRIDDYNELMSFI